MDDAQLASLATWIAEAGLAGRSEGDLVSAFCERLLELGVPLARGGVFIDTLHPIHEGRIFRWDRDKKTTTLTEYGRSDKGDADERWRRSPF